MENNEFNNQTGDSFEQTFMQNVQSSIPTPPQPTDNPVPPTGQFPPQTPINNNGNGSTSKKDPSPVPIIILAIFCIIQFIAIIVLTVMLVQASNSEDMDEDVEYTYNADGSVRTLYMTCNGEEDYYEFHPNGNYYKYLFTDDYLESGNYAFTDESTLVIVPSQDDAVEFEYSDNSFDNDGIYNCFDDSEGYDDEDNYEEDEEDEDEEYEDEEADEDYEEEEE